MGPRYLNFLEQFKPGSSDIEEGPQEESREENDMQALLKKEQ